MNIDGYEFRKCGACGERYYIRKDETECRSCRGELEESGDGKSDTSGVSSESADPVENATQNGNRKQSPAIQMIVDAHSKGDGDD